MPAMELLPPCSPGEGPVEVIRAEARQGLREGLPLGSSGSRGHGHSAFPARQGGEMPGHRRCVGRGWVSVSLLVLLLWKYRYKWEK